MRGLEELIVEIRINVLLSCTILEWGIIRCFPNFSCDGSLSDDMTKNR